jgi:peptidoglycan/LPS O-acetylase OafA/YrhL
MATIKKWLLTLIASIPGLFIEIQWLIFVVFFGFLFDCLTAYALNRRMKKKGLSTGKFSSNKFFKMVTRFIVCVAGILFCWMIDRYVLLDIQALHLANWLTLLICLGTAISILENITTESGDPLAVLIQKVLVSKAERHIEVDINNDGKIGENEANHS